VGVLLVEVVLKHTQCLHRGAQCRNREPLKKRARAGYSFLPSLVTAGDGLFPDQSEQASLIITIQGFDDKD
jgi:hypothetical protein